MSGVTVLWCRTCLKRKMASFDMIDEDDFSDIFVTQQPREDYVVSLEENSEFVSVRDPNYSDVSEEETEQIDRWLRCVVKIAYFVNL